MSKSHVLAFLAGRPEDSGISLQIVQELGPRIPVFGVCMGHQCIGQIFGARIIRAPKGVMHGKTSLVYHNNTSLLRVSNQFDLHLLRRRKQLLYALLDQGCKEDNETEMMSCLY